MATPLLQRVEAGATWWLERVEPYHAFADARRRIEVGPPV